ncbi:MAG: hypothetical protein DBP01_03330, partial [gamma proteobacterium symbiont of Ctena orbiculata]
TSDGGLGINLDEVVVQPQEETAIEVGTNVEIPSEIYRAYDIRGVVGESLNEEIVALLGQGIGSEIFEKGYQSIIVARDTRNSSERLQSALIQGLQASGRECHKPCRSRREFQHWCRPLSLSLPAVAPLPRRD